MHYNILMKQLRLGKKSMRMHQSSPKASIASRYAIHVFYKYFRYRSLLACAFVLFSLKLANRHFNRGIFLLEASPTLKERDSGYNDILCAKKLESEARACDKQFGKGQKAPQRFEVILHRIEGLCLLLKSPELTDVWGVDGLLEEMESLISHEREEEDLESPFFESVSKHGRQQQLECSRIKVLMARGDRENAYRIAVRMIVEDEFVRTFSLGHHHCYIDIIVSTFLCFVRFSLR